jgi:hypothetical protein
VRGILEMIYREVLDGLSHINPMPIVPKRLYLPVGALHAVLTDLVSRSLRTVPALADVLGEGLIDRIDGLSGFAETVEPAGE